MVMLMAQVAINIKQGSLACVNWPYLRKELTSWTTLGGIHIESIYGMEKQERYLTRAFTKTCIVQDTGPCANMLFRAEETNNRFKLLLEKGQTGLSVAFDLPTQLGLVPMIPSQKER